MSQGLDRAMQRRQTPSLHLAPHHPGATLTLVRGWQAIELDVQHQYARPRLCSATAVRRVALHGHGFLFVDPHTHQREFLGGIDITEYRMF